MINLISTITANILVHWLCPWDLPR